MANPATTHVIEIEAGIGEPAFIPLSMGQELQPISVGKKGMWRIESPRVLDVHAFVYFDGTSLFLQSADDANAASVDGYRIGKAWTELTAPCKIEIGQARLRFRSLVADADDQATQIAVSPPVTGVPGGPGSPLGNNSPFKSASQPGASMPVAVAVPAPPRMSTGERAMMQQQHSDSNPPVMFPKADRPFKPGEFAAPPDDESTRIAPLESTGAGRIVSGAHALPSGTNDVPRFVNSGPMMTVQGPMGQQPVQPLQFPPTMMMGSAPGSDPQMAQQQFDPPPSPYSNQGGPMTPMQPAGMMYPQQPQPGQPGSYPGQNQGYPNPGAPGPYNNGMQNNGMPNGMYAQQPPGPLDVMPPGMQGQTAPPPKAEGGLRAKLGGTSPISLAAGLLIIIGGTIFVFQDDDPPKQATHTKKDAGAATVATIPTTPPVAVGSTIAPPPVMDAGPANVAAGSSGQAPWPAGVPCPPPGWPPGTPLPCTPGVGGGTSAVDAGGPGPTAATNTTPPKPDKPDPPSRPGKAPSTPTLERQAVDYVAAGNIAKAADTYDELVRREPNNRVYAEAARILRAKLDAGASAP